MSTDLYSLKCRTINGEETSLEAFKDKVMLIVNTASRCGFTPQYKGLEALHQKYKDEGLVVLGFPCNQFRDQEPGDEGEIASFCEMNFGVSFPLFAKIDVNGDNAHPLFKQLKQAAPGLLGSQGVKWNFTKFLVAPGGQRVKRFAPLTKPARLEQEVEAMLRS
ncbi:glutathione peroxidase [Aestuariirhabdus litorea]|uniref:Glutathione peroxidase n=1 Tax=Aestuariirhabdus litorea TaxID=2528527 RepID=A0A3P3VUP2_9GAMM|nr:glutathione peroxidase [Aestuariirhabdus litorea]RRJ84473.1 glutathione peroxidase [Aestuariirhabdus litorea]RWW97697.1 glutathione peroxidase [Endozoicomonadaceae bacterium GTF-13]